MASTAELKKVCSQVRRDIIRMTSAVQSGHPGGSLGCTEYFVSLYYEILRQDKHHFNMDGIGEDIFFLSNGHISPVWYSVLAHSGFFPVKELATFRKLNTRLQGHPATAEHLPGVRIASGSSNVARQGYADRVERWFISGPVRTEVHAGKWRASQFAGRSWLRYCLCGRKHLSCGSRSRSECGEFQLCGG